MELKTTDLQVLEENMSLWSAMQEPWAVLDVGSQALFKQVLDDINFSVTLSTESVSITYRAAQIGEGAGIGLLSTSDEPDNPQSETWLTHERFGYSLCTEAFRQLRAAITEHAKARRYEYPRRPSFEINASYVHSCQVSQSLRRRAELDCYALNLREGNPVDEWANGHDFGCRVVPRSEIPKLVVTRIREH